MSYPLTVGQSKRRYARNGVRSGGTSHPRSIRFDDGSPAVSRLRGHWMVCGAYDCLYVTSSQDGTGLVRIGGLVPHEDVTSNAQHVF